MRKNYKILLSNLCCSVCKSEFDENSFSIIREENGLLTINLVCKKCGKDFGTGLIRLKKTKKDEAFTVVEGAKPITYDDVIDAHKFIKDLDKDWGKYFK